ncbi:hypothetical protein NQD34_013090 [Periophthalmus magnuspinnatus]|nr:hypothetical protein NQD34_013090 [Periophthalmus magnuspinnatus]
MSKIQYNDPRVSLIITIYQTKAQYRKKKNRKTGLTIHKDMFISHILHYKQSISTARSTYYSNLISSHEGNSKTLFSLLSQITKPPDSLPPHLYSSEFCNNLAAFFTTKIQLIHQQLNPSVSNPPVSSSASPMHLLSSFTLPSVTQISTFIRNSKSSTCQLDPLPTVLIKTSIPALSPLITEIIHSSLTSGTVPSTLKTAAVTPILKIPVLLPLTSITFVPFQTYPSFPNSLRKQLLPTSTLIFPPITSTNN